MEIRVKVDFAKPWECQKPLTVGGERTDFDFLAVSQVTNLNAEASC
jgi:hypothetical protein